MPSVAYRQEGYLAEGRGEDLRLVGYRLGKPKTRQVAFRGERFLAHFSFKRAGQGQEKYQKSELAVNSFEDFT